MCFILFGLSLRKSFNKRTFVHTFSCQKYDNYYGFTQSLHNNCNGKLFNVMQGLEFGTSFVNVFFLLGNHKIFLKE